MRSHHRVTPQEVTTVKNLHDRLMHAASPPIMKRAIRDCAWLGVPNIHPDAIDQVYLHQDCVACLLGKSNRLPRTLATNIKPNLIAECVSVDYKPVTPHGLGKYIGFYLFVELSVGYKIAVLTRENNHVQLHQAVVLVRSFYMQYGHTMKTLRADSGTVENTADLGISLGTLGITLQPAAPKSQFQNPVERAVQTVTKGTSAVMVNQNHLGNTAWPLALLAFIAASNCCPNSSSGTYSPEFCVTGHHPDISNRFPFPWGETVVSVVVDGTKHHDTFQTRAEFGLVVGFPPHSNGSVLLYIPAKGSRHFFIRRDVRPIRFGPEGMLRTLSEIQSLAPQEQPDGSVIFPHMEGTSQAYLQLCAAPWHPSHDAMDDSTVPAHTLTSTMWTPTENPQVTDNSHSPVELPPPPDDPGPNYDRLLLTPAVSRPSVVAPTLTPTNLATTMLSESEKRPLDDDTTPSLLIQPEPESKRPHRDIHVPSRYSDDQPAWLNGMTRVHDSDHPTLSQAQKGTEWDAVWAPAVRAELEGLEDRNTGTVVQPHEIPPGEIVYPSKIDLLKKKDSTGLLLKAKARLVLLGNMVKSVLTSLFAPTTNEKSLKLLFALAIIFSLTITGVDIKGAFLYPELPPDVTYYMELPRGLTGGTRVIWKLNKTLYGLPLSPHAFYEDVSSHLTSHGYTRTIADPCMFYKRDAGQMIFLVVHVDDFAIASSDPTLTSALLDILRLRYEITVEDSLESFLGLHIAYLSDGSVLFTQPRRIHELLVEYNLLDVPPPTVPMSTLFDDVYQNDAPACDYTLYMSLLGKLLFIIKTRPDIAYAVNRLATRAATATEKDYKALLRIVSYLGGTKNLGIRLNKNNPRDVAAATRLFCYVDAAYACHPDSKSHTGYCFSLGDRFNGMFFSRTFKQTNVTLSSTEAEHSAAVEAVKEIMWLRQLLSELGFPQLEPTPIFADSASMITLAEDYSGNHKRVKHYITRINFLIEQVKAGIVKFEHVSTDINIADILTKPLGPDQFLRLRPLLLGTHQGSTKI